MPIYRKVIILKTTETLKENPNGIPFEDIINILITLDTCPTKEKCAQIIGDFVKAGYYKLENGILFPGPKFKAVCK